MQMQHDIPGRVGNHHMAFLEEGGDRVAFMYRLVKGRAGTSSSSFLLSSLELSDAHVYEPEIRALLGTTAHLLRWYLDPKPLGFSISVSGFRALGLGF